MRGARRARGRRSSVRVARGSRGRWSSVRVAAVLVAAAVVAAAAASGCGAARERSSGSARSCPVGAVRLAGEDDVAAFAGCASAASITIKTGAKLELGALTALASIEGDLVVGPSFGVEELALRGLQRIGGALVITSNANLRGVFLPQLVEVGRIDIGGNVALTTISLPELATVAGAVAITGNAELELVDANNLATVGGELAIADNPNVALVELAALASAQTVRIDNNRALPSETVDAIRSKAVGSAARGPSPTPPDASGP